MSGVCAVICEFDPLHAGHKKVIDLAKSTSDVVIAVLSGNFTQRSLPAAFDKYTRARAAIACGVDLVVELPFPWSSSSVEFYAFGGVSVALSIGADSLCFGSECGNVDIIKKASEYSCSPVFIDAAFNQPNDSEVGAAKAIDEAFRKDGFIIGKNDKLAIEYLKSVLRSGCEGITFSTVKRDNDVPGASDIREIISGKGLSSAKDLIEPEAYEVYSSESAVLSYRDRFELISFLYFRFFFDGDFKGIFEASGGVGNRLLKTAASSETHRVFFASASTKKYTDSRIRRAALYSMIGVKKSDLTSPPSFTYLLAANDKGRNYLSQLGKAKIHVITKPSDVPSDPVSRQIALEMKADELYSLCCDPPAPYGRFIRSSPFIK
ncbi:MAG: nucleotidyltransferase family protein [Clostridia bacterium]|nr:nucleotidyltransferase family protein [Clostridia bacterium]